MAFSVNYVSTGQIETPLPATEKSSKNYNDPEAQCYSRLHRWPKFFFLNEKQEEIRVAK
jgi:hypothetical protein